MVPKSVLVIDDEPILRSLATEALGDEGYLVFAVEHTAAGLAALQERVFDLILLDHSTGELSDEQFIAQARRLPHGARPILLWTAWPQADEQATAMGADGALGKPISLDALFARLRQEIGEPEDESEPWVIPTSPSGSPPATLRP